MQNVRADLYEIISDGFERTLEGFVTETGEPDFMKALVHVLITEDYDGPAVGYGCSRLLPSRGTALTYEPPLHSSRHFEARHSCRYKRNDVDKWKDKNTLSGCLGGTEEAGKQIHIHIQ